jgi:hypothetical protein
MLTYKEFYIWLEGFMTNRDWTTIKQVDIETIQGKMKEVKEENKFGIAEPYMVPIPVSPLTKIGDIPPPPWDITCKIKEQLND